MATNLFETQTPADTISLLAGVEGREIKVGVMLAAGQGVLTRGSIIARKDSDKNWTLLEAAPTDTDRVAVLGTSVDTGAGGSTEDQLVDAFLSGLFNRAAISLGGHTELTADIEEALREKGIFMDCVIPGAGPVPGAEPPAAVQLLSATANGASGATTSTTMTLTFDVAVTGLTGDNVSITNGTGSATKGALSGGGTTWTLAITTVAQGNVTVAVNAPDGYTLTGSPQTVAVYATA
jgi:hypothetical protein